MLCEYSETKVSILKLSFLVCVFMLCYYVFMLDTAKRRAKSWDTRSNLTHF